MGAIEALVSTPQVRSALRAQPFLLPAGQPRSEVRWGPGDSGIKRNVHRCRGSISMDKTLNAGDFRSDGRSTGDGNCCRYGHTSIQRVGAETIEIAKKRSRDFK